MAPERTTRLALGLCLVALATLGLLAIGQASAGSIAAGVLVIAAALAVAARRASWNAINGGGEMVSGAEALRDARLHVEALELVARGDDAIDTLWRVDLDVEPAAGLAARWSPTRLGVVARAPRVVVGSDWIRSEAEGNAAEVRPAHLERLAVLDAEGLPTAAPDELAGRGRLRLLVAAPSDARELAIVHAGRNLAAMRLPAVPREEGVEEELQEPVGASS